MDEAIETYISEARKTGMADAQIKERLVKAGWVPDQIDPILYAVSADTTAATKSGGKPVFSVRKLPDYFIDYVWKKVF